ncbi:MAG: di-trans,poly-cis-decaprenylcistransferase [Dehalococcoidia bacterium]|nr:MAG: di-trans,poly-cis-decaprenylcistransferase [Dehalococcoidia bacterium]
MPADSESTATLLALLRRPAAPVLDIVYRVYERQLDRAIRRGPLPQHVGVILDGNRRFARKAGLSEVTDGHRRGADKVEELVGWCDDLEIPAVTLWALSTDNFKRGPDELKAIFSLIEEKVAAFSEGASPSARRRRVRMVGRRELLPQTTQDAIARAEEATANDGPYELLVAVGYGGREEITDAVRRMLADRIRNGDSLEGIASGIEPEEISRYLYAPDIPDPDLIIRTSGELRLSGFLLWQSAYSEYYFCDVFWPEFRRIDFLRAVRSYADRERRRGR